MTWSTSKGSPQRQSEGTTRWSGQPYLSARVSFHFILFNLCRIVERTLYLSSYVPVKGWGGGMH